MADSDSPKPAGAAPRQAAQAFRNPAIEVVSSSGLRSRVALAPLPFHIGRQRENHLVLRDNRISRSHARIISENGEYVIEDLESRQGVFVNGCRITRQKLASSDQIDFGLPDSYRLVFSLEADEIHSALDHLSSQGTGSSNLTKLRSLVEVARALQSSLSVNDVLAAVVDAALAVTGAERGFLLLKNGDELDVQVARDHRGAPGEEGRF